MKLEIRKLKLDLLQKFQSCFENPAEFGIVDIMSLEYSYAVCFTRLDIF